MAFFPQAHFDVSRQGQIHIVSAQNQMIAHGNAFEPGAALGLPQGNQGKVGGAAADITDQNQFIGRDKPAPAVLVANQPAVKGGKRLFQQG